MASLISIFSSKSKDPIICLILYFFKNELTNIKAQSGMIASLEQTIEMILFWYCSQS